MPNSSQPGAQDPAAVYISALKASHWKTRWQAAQALGDLKDPRAVEPLIEVLDDSNQWVRIVTAEALGQIGDRQATQALIYALNDSSIWVRRASVVALGQVGDPTSVSPLLDRLLRPPDSEWPEELHAVIAKALGAVGEPAVQRLIESLEDPDAWVSSAAARALGQIGDPRAIVPLTAMMERDNQWVHSAATQALAQMTDARALRAALTTDEAPRAFWKLMALKELDESTLRQLTALLQDPDQEIRARAAAVLNQLGAEPDADRLTAALREPAQVLWRARDAGPTEREEQVQQPSPDPELQESLDSLVEALQDPVAEVRLAAAEALGQVGDASVLPALKRALKDQDSQVRAAAIRSLGQISSRP